MRGAGPDPQVTLTAITRATASRSALPLENDSLPAR